MATLIDLKNTLMDELNKNPAKILTKSYSADGVSYQFHSLSEIYEFCKKVDNSTRTKKPIKMVPGF